VSPDAARPQVHLADRICEPRAAIPIRNVPGIRDRIPNEGAWCIEHAGDDDNGLVERTGVNYGCHGDIPF
jgi:hypothetical protein